MAKKIRDLIVVLICVAALLVSSVSACVCDHHEEGTEAASCHNHSHEPQAAHLEKAPPAQPVAGSEEQSHEHPAASSERHPHKHRAVASEHHSHERTANSEEHPHTPQAAGTENDSEDLAGGFSTPDILKTVFANESDSDCVCYQAAPKVVSNSKELKPVKYTAAVSSFVSVEPVYKTAILYVNSFVISRFIPTDSSYNLPPGRAPPRL